MSDYEKMELCRELARRILRLNKQILDIDVSYPASLLASIPDTQGNQKAEEALSLPS